MVIWDRDFGFSSDPFGEFDRLRRRMNQLLGPAMRMEARDTFPPVNIMSNKEKTVVTAEIPGVQKQDLDISVENDVLTLKGHREPVKTGENESFRRRERGHGSFRRVVGLPYAVNPDNVKAEYTNGILKIELSRHEASKPKQIEIS